MKITLKYISLLIVLIASFLSAAFFVSADVVTELKNQNLAYYKLEESTNPYNDEVNNLDLTSGNNPDRVTGKLDYGQDFEYDNSDGVYTAASESFELSEFLISGWVNVESATVDAYISSTYHRSPGADDSRYGWIMSIDTARKLSCRSFDLSTTPSAWVGTTVINTGTWYHAACYWDGAHWVGYLNGVEDGSEITTGASLGIEYESGTNTEFGINKVFRDGTFQYPGDAKYDEIYLGDATGYTENIDDIVAYLYNSGSPGIGQQYPFINSVPIVNLVYPLNATHYAWNGSFIINVTDVETDDIECIINLSGDSVIMDNNYPRYNYTFTGLLNTNYSFDIDCLSDYNSRNISGWFINDNINPNMVLHIPGNSVFISKNITTLVNYTVHVQDLYLYRVNATLYAPNGSIFYNNYSGDMSSQWYNITHIFNISPIPLGNYSSNIIAVDTHTAAEFKAKEIKNIDDKKGEYVFVKGKIQFIMSEGVTLESTKEKDRITQKYNFPKKAPREFDIMADSLYYINDSDYPCHFILNGNYWYDCVGLKNPKVFKINAKQYKIQFDSESGLVETRSIGGLNKLNYSSWFLVTELGPQSVYNSTTILEVISSSTGSLIPSALISQYEYINGWALISNFTSDNWGRAVVGYNTAANYTWIVSAGGYSTKNITVGIILYPDYLIELDGGVEMSPLILILFGALALGFWIFSFGIKRVSTYFIAGVLMLAFGALVWAYSIAFGLGFILSGMYSWFQIMS